MTSARRITLNRTAAGGGIDELLVVGLAVVLDQMLSMGALPYQHRTRRSAALQRSCGHRHRRCTARYPAQLS